MVYNFQEILALITYSVVTLVGLVLLVVLIRLYEVLGLLREVFRRMLLHRERITETLTQIRLFCQKFSRDPED